MTLHDNWLPISDFIVYPEQVPAVGPSRARPVVPRSVR
jgi:hypothetical protein